MPPTAPARRQSTVKATLGGKTLRSSGRSPAATAAVGRVAHFGLGDATNVTTLRIEWPSGIVQELHECCRQSVPHRHRATTAGSKRHGAQRWRCQRLVACRSEPNLPNPCLRRLGDLEPSHAGDYRCGRGGRLEPCRRKHRPAFLQSPIGWAAVKLARRIIPTRFYRLLVP